MTAAAPPDRPAPRIDHTPLEDAQAIVFGTLMAALGLLFLRSAGLVTGQMAGLALIVSYATGWELGLVFFALNLPFWALALMRMGWRFALKSALAVALLSSLVAVAPGWLTLEAGHPLIAAALGGIASGFGLLALFRHGASLGGIGVLGVWLQDRTGFRAGWTQMLVDAVVFGLALLVIEPSAVLWSLCGAVLLNLVIAVNHRRDRYIAM
ncbi:MAG: YitT family protein [Rubrimonas sp.]